MTGGITWFVIADELVEGRAVPRQLTASVSAFDHGQLTRYALGQHGQARHQIRGPLLGTIVIARAGLARLVEGVDVEGLAIWCHKVVTQLWRGGHAQGRRYGR